MYENSSVLHIKEMLNILEEWSSHLQNGRSLKSRTF